MAFSLSTEFIKLQSQNTNQIVVGTLYTHSFGYCIADFRVHNAQRKFCWNKQSAWKKKNETRTWINMKSRIKNLKKK